MKSMKSMKSMIFKGLWKCDFVENKINMHIFTLCAFWSVVFNEDLWRLLFLLVWDQVTHFGDQSAVPIEGLLSKESLNEFVVLESRPGPHLIHIGLWSEGPGLNIQAVEFHFFCNLRLRLTSSPILWQHSSKIFSNWCTKSIDVYPRHFLFWTSFKNFVVL